MIQAEGQVLHQTEYINTTPGEFPNFAFVRALKEALENSILNAIRVQLMDSSEADSKELIDFIETITNRKEGNRKIEGVRTMVDLCEVYKSCAEPLH